MLPILPLNCLARAELDMRSPSRAYNPPMKAPILVPVGCDQLICGHNQGRYEMFTSNVVNRNIIILKCLYQALLQLSNITI